MINYFNIKELSKNVFLLTNDLGRFVFLSKRELNAFLSGEIYDVPEFDDLKDRLSEHMFILPDNTEAAIRLVKDEYLQKHSHLLSAPSLHIFVLTNMCNFNCVYCQAHSVKTSNLQKMTKQTAESAVDIALQSPEKYLTFEFQGGEPLTNYDVLKHIVLYTEQKNTWHDITYTIVSNLTLLKKEQLIFLKEHNVRISTSLDGPESIHDQNRRYIGGGGTHKDVSTMMGYFRAIGENIGAIETTTKYSLEKYKQIVDEYVSKGVSCIFLRPLTKLGKAIKNWDEIGYSSNAFVHFYQNALSYIIELSKSGIDIREGHATLFLSNILARYHQNHMEFRSPCGGAIGQLAYNYDGKIYSCDEARMIAEMGDETFCLGNVYHSSFDDIMNQKTTNLLVTSSTLESIPECCDCVYQPYCGTCPVVNYSLYGSPIPREANSFRCSVYKGMFDTIFRMLYEGNEDTIDEFKKWINIGV
ncbi:MAG: His-Xaa-Ser system radical SAM maturase HxsB [Oscillospiraceae bacterium]|nr:His-Xaa-Ser system radical SAM maturase HxsB [Oscillospiraceae bacterium]